MIDRGTTKGLLFRNGLLAGDSRARNWIFSPRVALLVLLHFSLLFSGFYFFLFAGWYGNTVNRVNVYLYP